MTYQKSVPSIGNIENYLSFQLSGHFCNFGKVFFHRQKSTKLKYLQVVASALKS